MPFFISKEHGNIVANGVQLLASRHIVLKFYQIPAETENSRCVVFFCLFDSGGNIFRQKFINIIFSVENRANGLYAVQRIMSVTVAARRHDDTFAAVVDNFSFAGLDKCRRSEFVANVNKSAVFDCKRLSELIIFRRKNFSVNNKVGIGRGEHFNGKSYCQRTH